MICKTYLDVGSEEDFGVHYSWEPFERRGAYFIDVIKEEDKWRPLLQQAAEILARKVQKDIFLDPSTELYKADLYTGSMADCQHPDLPSAKGQEDQTWP